MITSSNDSANIEVRKIDSNPFYTSYEITDNNTETTIACVNGICPECSMSSVNTNEDDFTFKPVILFDIENHICLRCGKSQAKSESMKNFIENKAKEIIKYKNLTEARACFDVMLKAAAKYDNDNLSEKLNHKEIRDSFSSTTLENEDTGETVKAKIGLCPFCYDGTDKKLQFVIIDKNNYFCFLCYKYKAKSKFMRHWVKDGLKYMQKLDKYPGEMLPDAIRQVEEDPSSSKQISEIKSIIYDPSPMLIEFVSDLRNTNTYKRYPNQISDENKLIFTLYRILQYSDWKYSDSKPLFHLDPSTSTSKVIDDKFHAFIKSGKI